MCKKIWWTQTAIMCDKHFHKYIWNLFLISLKTTICFSMIFNIHMNVIFWYKSYVWLILNIMPVSICWIYLEGWRWTQIYYSEQHKYNKGNAARVSDALFDYKKIQRIRYKVHTNTIRVKCVYMGQKTSQSYQLIDKFKKSWKL